jgi:uncharacterized protein YdeI (YjbR/CyaY-like superfamily)
MKPTFFSTPALFRKWLMKNHQHESELLVGFYKAASGKKSINWKQAVEQALCFGWIDSTGRSLGDESFCVRFTPRKPTSIWSAININKVEELKQKGLMTPAGLAAYEKRSEKRSRIYSHENEPAKLDAASLKKLKANKKAWAFFNGQAPSYQKTCRHWIMGAKQKETKERRLLQLITDSEAQKRLKQFDYRKK